MVRNVLGLAASHTLCYRLVRAVYYNFHGITLKEVQEGTNSRTFHTLFRDTVSRCIV
jgi:hypothetical protein